MKVLIDADVIFDFVTARLPHFYDAKSIFTLADLREIEAYTLPHLLINVWQIRGHMKVSSLDMKKSLRGLIKIVQVLDESGQAAVDAINLNRPDLEDSLTIECAIEHKIDIILSRNLKHFKSSPVPALNPEQFLKKYFSDI